MKKHPSSRQPLSMWIYTAETNMWKTTSDIRKIYASADFLSGDRVIFNIGGNKFRLIVEVEYKDGAIIILGVYTHSEYSKKQF